MKRFMFWIMITITIGGLRYSCFLLICYSMVVDEPEHVHRLLSSLDNCLADNVSS